MLIGRVSGAPLLYIVDVREPDKFTSGRTLRGTLNLPLSEMRARRGDTPKDRDISLYYRVGQRAYFATLSSRHSATGRGPFRVGTRCTPASELRRRSVAALQLRVEAGAHVEPLYRYCARLKVSKSFDRPFGYRRLRRRDRSEADQPQVFSVDWCVAFSPLAPLHRTRSASANAA